jgi:hypothetical protein
MMDNVQPIDMMNFLNYLNRHFRYEIQTLNP